MNQAGWFVGGAAVLALVWAAQQSPAPPDDAWFRNAVTNYPRPVLVKFGAEWCPPCRMTDQALEKAQPQLSGKVKILLIDIDQKPELAQHYGVRSIPRVFLFDHGKIIARHGGFGDPADVQAWVNRSLR